MKSALCLAALLVLTVSLSGAQDAAGDPPAAPPAPLLVRDFVRAPKELFVEVPLEGSVQNVLPFLREKGIPFPDGSEALYSPKASAIALLAPAAAIRSTEAMVEEFGGKAERGEDRFGPTQIKIGATAYALKPDSPLLAPGHRLEPHELAEEAVIARQSIITRSGQRAKIEHTEMKGGAKEGEKPWPAFEDEEQKVVAQYWVDLEVDPVVSADGTIIDLNIAYELKVSNGSADAAWLDLSTALVLGRGKPQLVELGRIWSGTPEARQVVVVIGGELLDADGKPIPQRSRRFRDFDRDWGSDVDPF